MLKDGIKLISIPPLPKKRKKGKKKNISQTSMNCHVKFTIFLKKERKTTDLYIEILIVQANFFTVFCFIIIFSELMKLWTVCP